MKCSVKDFFSKCDQIRRKLRIWSHLLKRFLMESFIFLWSISPSFLIKGVRVFIKNTLKLRVENTKHNVQTEFLRVYLKKKYFIAQSYLHNQIFLWLIFRVTLHYEWVGLFYGITCDTVTYPAGFINAKVFSLQAYRHKHVTCKLFYRIFNNVKICNTVFSNTSSRCI